MWWLVPIGIAVGVKLIYDAVSESEIVARKNWESKRVEVERSIEDHRKNIESHLSQAQSSYDFHFLTDLHFSSHKVANAAYKLLQDARSSRDGVGKMLVAAKSKRISLQSSLAQARVARDGFAINDAIEQLKMVNDLRKSLFEDDDKIKGQSLQFLAEVQRLNTQTANLKNYIRDRRGQKGRDWYSKLEERIRLKRLSSR